MRLLKRGKIGIQERVIGTIVIIIGFLIIVFTYLNFSVNSLEFLGMVVGAFFIMYLGWGLGFQKTKLLG